MKQVVALARGFYGHLLEIGDRFHIQDDEDLADWMSEIGADGKPTKVKAGKRAAVKAPEVKTPPEAPISSAPFTVPEQIYKAKHNGAGNFIVVDADGKQVGEVFPVNKANNLEAKTNATAEADRLNAAAAADKAAAKADDDLPDA